MGCSTCGGSAAGTSIPLIYPFNSIQESVHDPCDYTIEQLKVWRDKIVCFKDKSYYVEYNITPAEINRNLGNVISAINYDTNLCFFKPQLDIALDLINIIINSGKC